MAAWLRSKWRQNKTESAEFAVIMAHFRMKNLILSAREVNEASPTCGLASL